MNNELCHYGVMGMKWGVRKYRKFNGSYTKAGVKRYDQSLKNYESLKAKKKQYGSKTMMDSKTTYGRATKLAKKQLKKDYKHLKQDKLGDQGKVLYSNGYRITNNVGTKLVKAGGMAGSATAYLYANHFIDKKQAQTLASISGATLAIGAGVEFANGRKNKKMRAYYGHTSKY